MPDGGTIPPALGKRVTTRLAGRKSRLPNRQHGARMPDANFGLFAREQLLFHRRPAGRVDSLSSSDSIRPVPRTTLPIMRHTSLQSNHFQSKLSTAQPRHLQPIDGQNSGQQQQTDGYSPLNHFGYCHVRHFNRIVGPLRSHSSD